MTARGAGYRVEVTGLRDLVAELRNTPGRMDKELRKANKNAVQKAIVPKVRRGAPYASGRLEKSVRGLASATRAQLAVGTNTGVPYAGPINFGWPSRNIAAQEFIYKGIVDAEPDVLEIYVIQVDKAVGPAFPQGKL
jgi:hypothetical protein